MPARRCSDSVGAGCLGVMAVQMAKVMGARASATAGSRGKVEVGRRWGRFSLQNKAALCGLEDPFEDLLRSVHTLDPDLELIAATDSPCKG